MKQMRTDLTPLRIKRCRAVIEGYGEQRAWRALESLSHRHRFGFVALLTDDAIEQLAFDLIGGHVSSNRNNTLNRALYAERNARAKA